MAFNFGKFVDEIELDKLPKCAATTIRIKKIKVPFKSDNHIYDSMVKDVYQDTHRAYSQRLAIGFRLLKG